MGMASRLSFAGAQSKVGLYHVGDDPLEGWYVPRGAAPTTHIVKAPTRVFPNQTVNEAFQNSFTITVPGSAEYRSDRYYYEVTGNTA